MGVENFKKVELFLNNSLQLWFLEEASLDYTTFSVFIVNQGVKRNMSSAEKYMTLGMKG